jgi:hypothetical protein
METNFPVSAETSAFVHPIFTMDIYDRSRFTSAIFAAYDGTDDPHQYNRHTQLNVA